MRIEGSVLLLESVSFHSVLRAHPFGKSLKGRVIEHDVDFVIIEIVLTEHVTDFLLGYPLVEDIVITGILPDKGIAAVLGQDIKIGNIKLFLGDSGVKVTAVKVVACGNVKELIIGNAGKDIVAYNGGGGVPFFLWRFLPGGVHFFRLSVAGGTIVLLKFLSVILLRAEKIFVHGALNGIDVYRVTVCKGVLFVVEDVEKGVLTEISRVLDDNIKVGVLTGIATGTAACKGNGLDGYANIVVFVKLLDATKYTGENVSLGL